MSKPAFSIIVSLSTAAVGSYLLYHYYNSRNIDLLTASREGNRGDIHNYWGKVDHVRDSQGNTPLILAATSGHVECVKQLIGKRANVNAINNDGVTALHSAANNKVPLEIISELLENGANVNAVSHNGITPIHVAATVGNRSFVELLVFSKADIDAQTGVGQTSLLLSSCNGHTSVVKFLLQKQADATKRTKQRHESPLYYAVGNGHTEIVEMLINYDKSLLTLATADGVYPIHVAAAKKNLGLIKVLIQHGEEISETKGDGSTVVHIAAQLDDVNFLSALLELGASINERDSFGCTPLHRACTKKYYHIVSELLKYGADTNILDNDKMSPLHVICSAAVLKDTDLDKQMQSTIIIFNKLLEANPDLLNIRDFSGATVLHHAVCREHNLFLVKAILEKNIKLAFMEDRNGRTPLHTVSQVYHYKDIIDTLTNAMKEVTPEFFDTFNPQRRIVRSQYDVSIDAQNQEVISLKGLATKINNGEIKNILILTGAGLSTNAGIPDFRGPSGIYINEKLRDKINMPVQTALSSATFQDNPAAFFAVIKELFLPVIQGKLRPTLAHKFIALLAKKGILLRNYTQNIDSLEKVSGVPVDKLIEAHGSFRSANCPRCSFVTQTSEPSSPFWEQIQADEIPVCPTCNIPLKPAVVLFGEGLPAIFFDYQKKDLSLCDLVIVMGTSLQVYPFAGLPNGVRSTVPRLLFNNKVTGLFEKGLKQEIKDGDLVTTSNEHSSNRDLAIIGDIDLCVQHFLSLLNWDVDKD